MNGLALQFALVRSYEGLSGSCLLAVLFLNSRRADKGRGLSGRSAAWLARLVRDQEVEGSNPFAPTTFLQPNQTVTAISCSTETSILGSLGSIEANEPGTSKPTPQRFTTSLRNATSFLIWS